MPIPRTTGPQDPAARRRGSPLRAVPPAAGGALERPPRLPLLDFDRTLADLGSHVAWERAASELVAWYEQSGIPRGGTGPGAISLYARMAASNTLSPRAREAAQRGAAAILTRYERKALAATRLLPGVGGALATLARAGLLAGVVSSNSPAVVHAILERDGVADGFGALVGREDVRRPKPAPEGLLLACRRLGVAPAESMFAGDNVADMEAARAAGISAVGVLGGDSSGAALRGAGARDVTGSVRELVGRMLPP